MVKTTREKLVTSERIKWVLIGIVNLALAYVLGSRALNTGSWWEYGGMLGFLIVGINRSLYAMHGAR